MNWFRWQNLNEKCVGKRTITGNPFWHSRVWLNLPSEKKFHIEYLLGRKVKNFALRLRLGQGMADGEDFQIHICLPFLFSVFFSSSGFLDTWKYDFDHWMYEGRNMGIDFYDMTLRIDFWEREKEWRSSDPWYMKGFRFNILDILFGRVKYTTETVQEKQSVLIPMPEKSYEAFVSVVNQKWIRSRWPWKPFSSSRYSSDVKIPNGIPFPGKGTCSYNCGDDALFGTGSEHIEIGRVIGDVVGHVMRNREKYETLDWQPRIKENK